MKENKIVIYADNHQAETKVTAILKNRCEVREKKLNAADYVLSKNVACERKTGSDFLQSLIDGRLFTQLTELKDRYKTPILLIEGDIDLENRNIHPNAVRGALASITVDLGVPVFWTKSQLESAEMLFTIAKREQNEKRNGIRLRNKRRFLSPNQQQEYIISGLPKVSSVIAKRLLKHFGSPERVFTATEEELQQVEGIGKIMAKKMRKLLTKKYEKSILED
ncbi:MAG: hypothetical protein HYW26_03360 [Candidatus Aenigmarchaeota archaeon]|nr:hypothetical protein [Candidatus Aenigmarchaeota archaeon]